MRSLVGLIGDYFDTSWVKNSIQYGRGESAFKLETVSNGQFDDLSKDVKENLLYTYRKLPKSMFNNLTLHSILSFFDSTELFFEILSTTISNYFEKLKSTRWNNYLAKVISQYIEGYTIFLIEATKAIVRLLLLWKNSGTILVHQKVPSRTSMSRENDFIFNKEQKRQTFKDLYNAQYSVTPTKTSLEIILSEVLWIIRPVLYVYYTKICKDNSWKPWTVSLIMDVLSYYFTKNVKMNEEEKSEKSRRALFLLFYILRGPFFDTFFSFDKNNIMYTLSNKIPFIGSVLSKLLILLYEYNIY